jgi:hypothetical protein
MTPTNTLQNIIAGNTDDIVDPKEKQYKMVEDGKKVPNAVMQNMVGRLRARGVPENEIVDRILFFDQLAEKDELVEYLAKQKQKV